MANVSPGNRKRIEPEQGNYASSTNRVLPNNTSAGIGGVKDVKASRMVTCYSLMVKICLFLAVALVGLPLIVFALSAIFAAVLGSIECAADSKDAGRGENLADLDGSRRMLRSSTEHSGAPSAEVEEELSDLCSFCACQTLNP